MIVRLWFGSTSFKKADKYVNHVKHSVFPQIQKITGYERGYILRRNLDTGVEFAVLTMWKSMDAIRGFSGEHTDQAVVAPEARALLRDFDKTVKHYEIVAR